MALLSCWGEVTTENEAEVVAANKRIHPQIEELLSVLSGILDAGRVEYWIDQGTLLGAYRHGKFIARDSDADIAIRNEEHFETLPDLLDAKLPCGYGWERKGDHCIGYRIWLKSGGNFKGSFKGKTIEWPLVVCDVMLYQFNETEEAYVQKYQGFGVDSCFYSEDVVFPLDRIEFEGKAYPCPAQVKEYLEIQYGYIGEGAVWVAEANRWAKGLPGLSEAPARASSATPARRAFVAGSIASSFSACGDSPQGPKTPQSVSKLRSPDCPTSPDGKQIAELATGESDD